MRGKTIKAMFSGNQSVYTDSVWQYDYGQELHISGIDLPDVFEAHFGNHPTGGVTKTQVGENSVVAVPDEYLKSGQAVHVFIFLHDEAEDGETEYSITIPVRKRPLPITVEPSNEQRGVIERAIAALENALAQTEQNRNAAEAAGNRAEGAVNTIQSSMRLWIFEKLGLVIIDGELNQAFEVEEAGEGEENEERSEESNGCGN